MVIDFLIVGAGMYGSVMARRLTDAGKKCLVIDKRPHVGGNCYSEQVCGVEVHKYGPHIFHTNSEAVWKFLSRFASFNNYRHRVKASVRGVIYSLPVNLMTLHQLWGVMTPAQAEAKLREVRVPISSPENLAEWMLSRVGEEVFELFFRGYTEKQWGRRAEELPASIIRRLPIRLTHDDDYFDAKYQGIPVEGYGTMFENLLNGIPVELNTEYFGSRGAERVVYTGPLDSLFGHRFGRLEYRSLRFETEVYSVEDCQGVAQMNYPGSEPFTRVVEHKHFSGGKSPQTVVTWEYPEAVGEPFYPVRDAENASRHREYLKLAAESGLVVGGRLGDYRYYDMDAAAAAALRCARTLLS